MKLNGRRQSSNVDDRRGSRGRRTTTLAGGIGGIIIAALIAWISGGNPLDVLTQGAGNMLTSGTQGADYVPTPEDEELARFSSQILAGTEDVWTEQFNRMGMEYEPPKLVLYTGSTPTACGNGQAAMGPFYCSADQTVYLDLSFFKDMRRTLGADGDFAYAYVIAHEVGYHVQYLLGILDDAHTQMSRLPEAQANRISVRLELQADYLAGVWAKHDNERFGSLEEGDIEEAVQTAQKIGDDYLQRKAQGYAIPESFNHGTSEQRQRWLLKGLRSGDVSNGDTFSVSYESL